MQRFLNNWSVLCTATEAHFGKGGKCGGAVQEIIALLQWV